MVQKMQEQAFALTDAFLSHVKKMQKNEAGKYVCSASFKKAILENTFYLLNAGLDSQDLMELIISSQDTKEEMACYNLQEYLGLKRKDFVVPNIQLFSQKKNECIIIGKFYNHPHLQLTSKPVRYLYDMQTFETIKVEPEPFFLEIVPSFTIDDAVAYFIRETGASDIRPERYTTQMKRIIQDFDLDLTLYLIDAAVADASSENEPCITTPAFLVDYLDSAIQMLELRKTTLKEAGLNHVIRK